MKKRIVLHAVCLVALAVPLTRAQTQDSTKTNNNSPSAAPTDAAAASASGKKAADEKKPKKVWTNEEVGNLKGDVSVVGDKRPAQGKTARAQSDYNEDGGSHEQRIQEYREAIAQLRGQIDAADGRIAQLKNFKADNSSPSGGLTLHKGYTMLPPEEQVKQLEVKKKQLQAKIDDLEVQAGKEGIEPGELR